MSQNINAAKAPSRLPRLYSVAETAIYLEVNEKTVLAMIKRKTLPAAKAGREYRITEFALTAHVTGGRK